MPIIYSLVSFKQTAQAEATTPGLTGNFGEVAKMLVKKLPGANAKQTYIYDSYMFHYMVEDGWTFLCICDQHFQRMLAFNFLADVAAFVKNPAATRSVPAPPTDSATPTLTPLQLFLNKQMDKFNNLVTEKHHKIYSDISELKDSMIANIDQVLDRGERIDLLVDKSENLNEMSFVFKKNSKRLKDALWWKNTKMIILLAGIGLFILYVIIASKCGGLTWPDC